MTLKGLTVSLLTLASIGLFSPVLAQEQWPADFGDEMLAQGAPSFEGGGMGGGFGGGQFMPGKHGQGKGPFAQLGLSPQQKQKLQSLLKSGQQNGKGNRQALMQKRQQLMEMIRSGSGSKQQALALHREITQQQNRLMEQRIGMIYDIKSVLTPEQFEKFQAMMKQKQHMGGGKGMGPSKGMGPGGFQGRGPAGFQGQGRMPGAGGGGQGFGGPPPMGEEFGGLGE